MLNSSFSTHYYHCCEYCLGAWISGPEDFDNLNCASILNSIQVPSERDYCSDSERGHVVDFATKSFDCFD